MMNFSRQAKNKSSKLDFWTEFRHKLLEYFEDSIVKKLTGDGLLCPLSINARTLKLVYDASRLEELKLLITPTEETLKKLISYIMPDIKRVIFIPDEAVTSHGFVDSEYENHPIFEIKF